MVPTAGATAIWASSARDPALTVALDGATTFPLSWIVSRPRKRLGAR